MTPLMAAGQLIGSPQPDITRQLLTSTLPRPTFSLGSSVRAHEWPIIGGLALSFPACGSWGGWSSALLSKPTRARKQPLHRRNNDRAPPPSGVPYNAAVALGLLTSITSLLLAPTAESRRLQRIPCAVL